jgi:H+/Cl- antiporter ClcA
VSAEIMTESLFFEQTIFPMIVSAVAAYRMARMIVSETGPLAIFARLRRYIDPQQKTWVGVGLNCPYCMGLWSSLVFYWFLKYNSSETIHFLIYVLAIAGIQTVIQSWEPIPPPPPDLHSDAPLEHPSAEAVATHHGNNGVKQTVDDRELQSLPN